MKKFYFLLVAMVIGCFSASAIDYYLIGGFNGWTTKDANCKFTAQGDGTYILNYNGTLTSGFKINDGTWSNDEADFGGSATLVPGTTYNLVKKGGNIPIAKDIVNPTIVFNPTAKTLLITGEQEETVIAYALSGQIFGGSWTDVVMTESDGNWVLPARSYVAGEFGIKKINAKTLSQLVWISANGTTSVTINKAMSCKEEGSNFSLRTAGEYTVTFDPEAMTVLFASEGGDTPDPIDPDPVEPTVDYSKWYVNVVGNFNSWKDNGLNPVDGISTHEELAIGTSEFKIKVWDGSADVYHSNGAALAQGEWIAIPDNNNANMTIAGAKAGESFKVEFNCATNEIRVTSLGGGEDPVDPDPIDPDPVDPDPVDPTVDYSKWYVNAIGDFNSWKDNGLNPVDGISTHEELAIGTSEFKIKVWDGSADVYHSNGAALAQGEWIAIPDNNDANMTIAGAKAGESFKVEFNCATNEIRVTSLGGGEDPIEPDPVEPETLSFGIVGSMQEPTVWDLDNMFEMTEADGVYTYTFDELAEGTTFKIGTIGKGWGETYGAENPDTEATQATDIDVILGEPMNAAKGSSNNFLIAESLTDVTITFAYNESGVSTVTVTGNAEAEDPEIPDTPVYPNEYTAQFDFEAYCDEQNDDDWLADGSNKYIVVSDKKFEVDGVSIVATKGTSNEARLYEISGGVKDFRFGTGSTLTITAPQDYSITSVTFSSPTTKAVCNLDKLSADGWTNTVATTVPDGMKCSYVFTPATRSTSSQLVIDSTKNTRVSLIDVAVHNNTSGIDEVITVINDAPVEYYNLNGVRVSEPSNGIYIRRQGNEVTKVIIK